MIEGLELGAARTIVDAGAGTGAFTGAILDGCAPDAFVVAVELNAAFVARLERRYPDVEVVHDSVERLPDVLAGLGRPQADVVVCGVPWAILDAATQSRLLAGIAGGLKEGGRFATFGYVHCSALPGCRRFLRLLERDFVAFETSPVVWLNLPPAVVYRCRRRARTAC
jgi:phospholipid N-methyltransferase